MKAGRLAIWILYGLLWAPALLAQTPAGTVFTRVDVPPRFPDSTGAEVFIADHLDYPEATLRVGQQGKVIVRFVVEPDGRVTNASVVRSPDDPSGAAVLKVVQDMPRWIPGRLRGRAVRTAVVLPVQFGLK